jgi:ABC-type bacteriocin/lantibiotic exporter with double-glycine peptidase domain
MNPEHLYDVFFAVSFSLILGHYDLELLKATMCLAFFCMVLALELKMMRRRTFNPIQSDADAFAPLMTLLAIIGIVASIAWAWKVV